MKSLQKEQIAQIYYYEAQSARINVQSPQSESTPSRLTLASFQTAYYQIKLIDQIDKNTKI